MSNGGICLPRFEIQTPELTGLVDTNGLMSKIFGMQKISAEPTSVAELTLAERLVDFLSKTILSNSFDRGKIQESIVNVFDSNDTMIFKFSDYGYCKKTSTEKKLISECHAMSTGTDIPSVMTKDITYSLIQEEITGNADYASDFSVRNYHDFFKELHFIQYERNLYLMYEGLKQVLKR